LLLLLLPAAAFVVVVDLESKVLSSFISLK
jgi:hypothetical protein